MLVLKKNEHKPEIEKTGSKKWGYARVSRHKQDLSLQIDALNKWGVHEIIQEKETGKRTDRPELDRLLKMLRPGDSITIYKLDRISRSTKHLIELSDFFEINAIEFISIMDGVDTSTSIGRFFFRTLASIAELEVDIIRERTHAGLQAARARGRYGGRRAVNTEDLKIAFMMYDSKEYTIKQITEKTGIAKATLYKYLEQRTSN
jgi:DNA invertase Pin-like site-specific DNA recombinase